MLFQLVLLFGSLLAVLAAAVGVVAAVLLRQRGRAVPPWLVVASAASLGLSQSFVLVFFIQQPLLLPPAAILPGWAVYALLRRGRFVAAGALLIGLGLPSVAWWCTFLVRDALDPLLSYQPVLWLFVAPGAVLAAAGVALVVVGDRRVPPARLLPQPPSLARDPFAIAHAISHAVMLGPIPMPSLIAEGGGLLLIIFAMPLAVSWGVPWPAGLLVSTLLYAVLGTELWYPALGRRLRSAWEGYAAVGSPEMRRFKETTGTPIPTSARAIDAWLRDNAETPHNRWARAELLAGVGRLDEARDALARMTDDAPRERFYRRSMEAWFDWLEGGTMDVEDLRREAERVGEEGSADRTWARGEAVLAETRDLIARGEPWMGPLIAYRRQVGPVAGQMFREDTRWPRFSRLLLIGIVFSGVVLLLGDLLT